MRVFLLVILCAVASKDVLADEENELKRGVFPYMVFLYYPDETVILKSGARFMRGGVLLTNDWLISSGDVALEYPKKTLLARAGAINIDSKFSFNEDEEEQEREIIVILRPYNYSTTEWWYENISLLKTLLPFNMTSSIAFNPSIGNFYNIEKECFVLIYAKQYENATERNLRQMFVELLPSNPDNCGNHFRKETMVCAADSENKTNSVADSNFCEGNSGGPLICDDVLIGIQTYFNDCNQPYLYQLLSGWKDLISCATQERYLTEPCAISLNKDPPTSKKSDLAITDVGVTETSELIGMTNEGVSEKIYDDVATKTTILIKDSVVNESNMSRTTVTDMIEEHKLNDTTIATISYSHDTTGIVTTKILAYTEEEAMDSTEERERESHIEAQHQLVSSDASKINPNVFNYLVFLTSILACLT